MKPFRTLVVEDEQDSLDFLLPSLREFPKVFDEPLVARSFEAAVDIIATNPDDEPIQVSILDNYLKDHRAAELFKRFHPSRFGIIVFTSVDRKIMDLITAFGEKALPLAKPSTVDVVGRVVPQIEQLWQEKNKARKKVVVPAINGRGKVVVHMDHILCIGSDGNNITVYYIDQYKNLKRSTFKKSLTEISHQLDSTMLVRCHNSWIVNMKHIASYQPNDNGGTISLNFFGEAFVPYRPHFKPYLEEWYV